MADPIACGRDSLPPAPRIGYNPVRRFAQDRMPVGYPASQRGRTVQVTPFYPAGQDRGSWPCSARGPREKSLFVRRQIVGWRVLE
jgi:hypothetical protein